MTSEGQMSCPGPLCTEPPSPSGWRHSLDTSVLRTLCAGPDPFLQSQLQWWVVVTGLPSVEGHRPGPDSQVQVVVPGG